MVFQEIDGQALLLLTLPDVQEHLDLKLGPAVKLCHHVERVKVAFYEQFASSVTTSRKDDEQFMEPAPSGVKPRRTHQRRFLRTIHVTRAEWCKATSSASKSPSTSSLRALRQVVLIFLC